MMFAVRCRVLVCSLAAVFTLITATLCAGDDWPQWRGPDRSAVSKEAGLLKEWPKDGPPLTWQIKDAGEGYSGPAIANGLLFTMGNRDGKEYVLCYDVKDGKEKWALENGPAYANDFGGGPRSTPTVDGDRVYALGASGDLCCLKAADGKEVWRLNILEKFKGDNISWGISESPLIEDKLCVVTPGGDDGTIVALDKMTGKTQWTSKDPAVKGREAAGYASPIAFNLGNERLIATFTSKGGICVRAADGKWLWRNDEAANGTANIATPIFHKDGVFFSSDYGQGCALADAKDVQNGVAKTVYANKSMANHHGGIVLVNGHLYGFSGARLACVEWTEGKQTWSEPSVGKGSVCYADGRLYILSEGGVAALAEVSPKAYKEISNFKLPDRSKKNSWTHPVVANGKLYLRDQNNLFCYDVKAK